MIGYALAYNPCFKCQEKDNCNMCELTYRRKNQLIDNEDRIRNEAIDAFAQRLMRYYQTQRDSSLPAVVEYHIKQIANDMKRKEANEKS